MHRLFLLMSAICFGIHAGEQLKISKQRYSSQRGDASGRGKKRNQKRKPTLEALAREKFPGPDVQLGQKKAKTSSERRKRAKAWQETVLLEETGKSGSTQQIGAVQALLDAKINPNMKHLTECEVSFQGSPLCNAARSGNKALAELLLTAGAVANMSYWFSSKRGYGIEQPIHAAARVRKDQTEFEGYYPEVIRLLHEHGADVNAGGESEALPFAPIHMVVLQQARQGENSDSRIARQLATLNALIACGADLEKETFNGDTAIALAKKRGNDAVAHFLEGALEDQNKNEFIKHFAACQVDRSPVSMRKAARALSKNRRTGQRYKNEPMAAASSSYGLAE